MKKARRIKAGVLAFTAVVSVAVTSVPVYAVCLLYTSDAADD